jgi:hypothetical protein
LKKRVTQTQRKRERERERDISSNVSDSCKKTRLVNISLNEGCGIAQLVECPPKEPEV